MNNHEGTEENKKIWDFYQTQGIGSFDQNGPRLEYLLNQISCWQKTKGPVLNIGAGNARFEKMAKARGVQTETLDISEKSVQHLSTLGFKAHCGDIRKSDLADATYSCVVASEVLEHLAAEGLEPALSEIRRLLVPGGIFIGTVPFSENLEENTMMCPSCGYHFHRWGHQTSFSKLALKEALVQGGFHIIRIDVRTFVQWRGRGPMGFVKSFVRWLLGRMGEPISSPHIFFLARK